MSRTLRKSTTGPMTLTISVLISFARTVVKASDIRWIGTSWNCTHKPFLSITISKGLRKPSYDTTIRSSTLCLYGPPLVMNLKSFSESNSRTKWFFESGCASIVSWMPRHYSSPRIVPWHYRVHPSSRRRSWAISLLILPSNIGVEFFLLINVTPIIDH